MQTTNPTTYKDISKDNYEAFKNNAKTHGMNISGNSDNVSFDHIPVHVEYTPDEKKLQFTITEPHWIAPGVTAAALHRLVSAAVDGADVPKENENPQFTHERSKQEAMKTVHDKDDEDKAENKTGAHHAHVTHKK